ncbi:MAG: polysaccharide deacetylase [Rhodospirillaceae bacterium]|nr:polysaccharide deacetylase [Rhodospirillaceae bacterium]|tara:strand:- start:1024 stop:1788 length:765 start_codon:yes stop_codon:yes gene_type:complete
MTLELEIEALHLELNEWSKNSYVAQIWWRDDDLHKPTAALDFLLKASSTLPFKPLLAVIPSLTSKDLCSILTGSGLAVGVHGFRHVNHEGNHEKKSEFGPSRRLQDQIDDVKNARQALYELLGESVFDCFVPPWNRLNNSLIPHLPILGLSSLSTFGGRKSKQPCPGLLQINTHVDIIDWKSKRAFIGGESMAAQISNHLTQIRSKFSSKPEPLGLLSHHLQMKKEDWLEFQTVCFALENHPAAYLTNPHELFL